MYIHDIPFEDAINTYENIVFKFAYASVCGIKVSHFLDH